MLVTLDQFKTFLEVADDGQDDMLGALIGAASDKVLALCGYAETDTAGIVETFRNVQQSREVQLNYRRVVDDASFTVEGRGHGTTFGALAKDLLDPDEGVFLVLGSAEWWPPNYVEERRPSFRRWREPTWPVVRVTYNVTGIVDADGVAPEPLVAATLELGSFWRSRIEAGASTQVQVGQVRQLISTKPLPVELPSILGAHYRPRRQATWCR